MTSEAIENRINKGTIIEGLFGMIDILGYKNLIKNNIYSYFIHICYNCIHIRIWLP